MGGVADGTMGVSAMDFYAGDFGAQGETGPLTAQKTWFFLPEGAVAAVHNVSSAAPCGLPIVTTLEQSLLQGSVHVHDGSVLTGNKTLTGGGWVHHNDILYLINASASASISLRAGPQQGRWSDINAAANESLQMRNIFYAGVVHGAGHPLSTPAFAYSVLPNVPLAAAASTALDFTRRTSLLRNDAGAQVWVAAPPLGAGATRPSLPACLPAKLPAPRLPAACPVWPLLAYPLACFTSSFVVCEMMHLSTHSPPTRGTSSSHRTPLLLL